MFRSNLRLNILVCARMTGSYSLELVATRQLPRAGLPAVASSDSGGPEDTKKTAASSLRRTTENGRINPKSEKL